MQLLILEGEHCTHLPDSHTFLLGYELQSEDVVQIDTLLLQSGENTNIALLLDPLFLPGIIK